jgi:ATP-dependent DNA helicase RecQ
MDRIQSTTESWPELRLKAESAAAKRGGFKLKPLQEEALFHLASGRSVFAGLPTGYGKSACFWLPAAAWGWRVWVISPLVSLMDDQAMAAARLGLRALALKSGAARDDSHERKRQLERGDWELCFLAPERLELWGRSGYLRRLTALGLEPDLVVLDEMHCLEEWRFFRPAYNELFEKIKNWRGRNKLVLGLSATMPERDSRSWMKELCEEYVHLSFGLGRENLRLGVFPLEEERSRWLFLLSALRGLREPECALVYCGTRRETDEVAQWLRSCGQPACAYHAGLPHAVRSARTEAFRRGLLRIVCATSAFGMGIDYPYVSRVIHFSMPHDLESYWQEVGRAGRSGNEAQALAFWRRSEIARLRVLRDPGAVDRFAALWRSWIRGGCRKRAVAARLGVECVDCGVCDRCLPGELPLIGRAPGTPWWLEPEAIAESWLDEKINSLKGRDASALST